MYRWPFGIMYASKTWCFSKQNTKKDSSPLFISVNFSLPSVT